MKQILKEGYHNLAGINKIAILADPACRAGWEKNFPRLLDKVMAEHNPELFVVAGDMALNATAFEYEAILGYMARYPARWAVVPGDHDRPLKLFRKHFGPTRKVIDVGKWRFIGINTANRMFLKKEEEFVEKHIRENTILFSHLPPEAPGWTFHSLWPRSSNRFLDMVGRHQKKIHSMYFGHIHGYSERNYLGIPMIVTGAVAESKIVRDNRYQGEGTFEMVIFDVAGGKRQLCEMD